MQNLARDAGPGLRRDDNALTRLNPIWLCHIVFLSSTRQKLKSALLGGL
ncbi:MAG: hypothetical protein LBJ18_03370 [Rickettsiales bacterium]|nr:hypothetical protein [Rickettsiales bacterium]